MCAPAYAGLADTLAVMAVNDQEPTLAIMPRAHAAQRALELRPGWPEALASSGFIKSVFDWYWEGGARDFQSAVQQQSSCSTAHYLFGIANLPPRGLRQQAIRSLETALNLDPVSPLLLRDLGLIHFMARAWDDAEALWRRAEELSPGYRGCLYWRARLLIETGNTGADYGAAGPVRLRRCEHASAGDDRLRTGAQWSKRSKPSPSWMS